MDQPLTLWYCDVCERPVNADNAYATWKTRDGLKRRDFKVIHRRTCHRNVHDDVMPLNQVLGTSGQAYLLAMLSAGPLLKDSHNVSRCEIGDMDNFVDFMRRMQTPYYEEARRYFRLYTVRDDFSDAKETWPYTPDSLKLMIIEHGLMRHASCEAS